MNIITPKNNQFYPNFSKAKIVILTAQILEKQLNKMKQNGIDVDAFDVSTIKEFEKAIKNGIEEGMLIGYIQETIKIILRSHKLELPIETVAMLTNLYVEEVEQILQENGLLNENSSIVTNTN